MASSLDSRVVFDAILQSAAVAVFHSMNVALAPIPRKKDDVERDADDKLSSSISFDAPLIRGELLLAVPNAVLELMCRDVGQTVKPGDVVKDLANQLLGRIKNRVAQFGTVLRVGLPVRATAAELLTRKLADPAASVAVYSFRTLRGVVTITVRGTIEATALNYSGAVRIFNEGDVIIF